MASAVRHEVLPQHLAHRRARQPLVVADQVQLDERAMKPIAALLAHAKCSWSPPNAKELIEQSKELGYVCSNRCVKVFQVDSPMGEEEVFQALARSGCNKVGAAIHLWFAGIRPNTQRQRPVHSLCSIKVHEQHLKLVLGGNAQERILFLRIPPPSYQNCYVLGIETK